MFAISCIEASYNLQYLALLIYSMAAISSFYYTGQLFDQPRWNTSPKISQTETKQIKVLLVFTFLITKPKTQSMYLFTFRPLFYSILISHKLELCLVLDIFGYFIIHEALLSPLTTVFLLVPKKHEFFVIKAITSESWSILGLPFEWREINVSVSLFYSLTSLNILSNADFLRELVVSSLFVSQGFFYWTTIKHSNIVIVFGSTVLAVILPFFKHR